MTSIYQNRKPLKFFVLISFLSFIVLFQGCETGYYLHLAKGQKQLLSSRIPTQDLLQNPEIDPILKERLQLTQEILVFAKKSLKLPVDGHYSTYVNLKRPYAIWSVSAAPELSLKPHQWCYPIVGCANYRGYFDEKKAKKTIQKLQEKGLETSLRGVSAYSTLGWFEDPILSSFDRYPNDDYIELLFHELAHSQLYIANNTTFNESFASFVGQQGLREYRAVTAQNPALNLQEKFSRTTHKKTQKEFKELVLRYKNQLELLYNNKTKTENEKKHSKAMIFAALQSEYSTLKQGWPKPTAYDRWMASINNAQIMVFSDYEAMVPTFAALFDQCEKNWTCFYSEVEILSKKAAHTND